MAKRFFIIVCAVLVLFSCENYKEVNIDGELKKWHRVTLNFEGPQTSEMDENNPFLNYRLDVTFNNGEETFVIPGFYATDGNAADTSSDTGNIWQVRFIPNITGEWTYAVSFKEGENVAITEDITNASSAGFMDGQTGSFVIAESDKTGIDNRAKGKLEYVGESYLKFADSQKYFIKLGVDAPENLLAYTDFDVSTNALGFQKAWEPHAKDFEESATPYIWQETKGKNLLGAINYLASEELNVFSFLTFNVDGDDRNIFPHLLKVPIEDYERYASVKKNKEAWETMFHKTRFDVSKLDQWERVFEYAETKGMFLHFKTHETETDHLMDKGVFGTEGKLYYRELIARFGHHLSMNWNLGEENNQPTEEVLKVANYVSKLDAYKSHLVLHTFPNKDDRYHDFVGDKSPLTGASLQLSHPEFIDVHPRVLKWRNKSNATGRKWALAVDEPGKANIALLPDDEDPEHNYARGRAMYGTLMAGGYGVEWYFGYASPNSDLTCQDFRSRDLFWDQNKHALDFFNNYIPFWDMEPKDDLITSEAIAYCFAKMDEVYAIYVEANADKATLDLGNSGKTFDIKWFDPRNGGSLQEGSNTSVIATGNAELGAPPSSPEKDWIILIQKI
ncbi:DUF5060 domain-containing protein [Seonamhaeicola aphaedonensis]|uniref:Collagenase-like protein with putative collagen-binding domain n=1 Tax=Seonamhaeicola aphaedonensis TaxID=1461338 RepID=A0A3D9HEW0_9FLAO|nr:DUF5060 domain-containing protein [Seonamhaeicola aphaedonensis]RED47781.1 collagenase-like protein with putative collagen-binding domain [Seonamhaeicola aphaedonensis]